jgi:glycerol uptake facilitator-like aquaporin
MNFGHVIGTMLLLFGGGCLVITILVKKMKFKDPSNEQPTIKTLWGLGILLLIVGAILLIS